MNSVLFSGVFAVVALSVAGAPSYFDGEQPRYVNTQQIEEFLRERRAPYGQQQHYGQQFVSPCASAGAVQVPISSVPVAGFASPSHPGYAIPQYGYAGPHYRSIEELQEAELMGFSDMDRLAQGHVPMARWGGYGGAGVSGVSPTVSAAGGHVLSQATSGTALGVFPNANVGGCSVPLLLSCSPSIVTGRMMEAQGHGPLTASTSPTAGYVAAATAAAAESYRQVEEPMQHEQHDKHEELLTHEHLNNEPSHVAHQ